MSARFLVIDKPEGVTSHDVVAAVRAVTGVKKVGHTGTLDPFATGVLALALGPATRVVQYLDESIKVYDATIQLGTATDTGDPTGEVIREAPVPELDEEGVEAVLASFVGERMQKPPPYSAVKFNGKPLYWYARRGETVEVPARQITINALELLELGPDSVRIVITCSRGTYARVIADEVATALGTAGHLSALARRRSGPFFLDDALTIQQLADIVAPDSDKSWKDILFGRGPREERVPWRPRDDVRADIAPFLRRPVDAMSHLPLLDVSEDDARRVRNGGLPGTLPSGLSIGDRFLVVFGDELLAIGEAAPRGPKVLRVLGEERPKQRRRRGRPNRRP